MRLQGVPLPRRLRGKQRILETPEKKAQPAPKEARKAQPAPKKVKASEVEEVALPVTKVVREPTSTRRGEAYLLDGNKKYIMGLGSRKTDKYADIIEEAMEKFNMMTFKSKDDAKEWIDSVVE